ncbi:TetR/AcrR family transcriptional regulator [Cohnella sp.]|uniref:TetR/AcrR family transcriptional regulator n=1 Tax=Cohnella sp. TaxID=1883426 RepID=UPI003566A0F9
MPEKMDRRQARTKQLLRKALMSLIEEKRIEGITVTDIATRADINRGTFYLHYRDVADMLEQMKDEAFEQIRSNIQQLDPKELMEYADKNEPYPKIVGIFEQFAQQAEFFKVMFGPHGDLSYILRYKELMKTHIYNRLSYWAPQEENRLVPLDYLIAYMAAANLGVLLHWLESGMKQSPQELGIMMTRLVNHGPIASSGLRGQTSRRS